ncbi:MAG: twin-arginine translocase subunit TatC [Christensenellaceae bacterium]|nr:twin-arginine translocase subunit TatC [Christensenellaceae bacterium]
MRKKNAEQAGKRDESVNAEVQPLLYHLMALRKLLTACVIAVLAGFVVSFYFLCEPLMRFITNPIEARGVSIIYTAVSEALTTQLKVSLVAGVVIVSPFVFYQIWAFVKPALYDNEIRVFRVLFGVALALFLLGVTFCYRYVYGLALNFFLVAGENLATPMLSIDKYVGFLFSFILPFGVVFELPIAIYMATRVGWVDYQKLASWRKFVFFGIFIFAAILTPPDVISQVMLGVPMYVLFELGVQVSRFTKNHRKQS